MAQVHTAGSDRNVGRHLSGFWRRFVQMFGVMVMLGLKVYRRGAYSMETARQ